MNTSKFTFREVINSLEIIRTLIEFYIKDPDPELVEFALKIIGRTKKMLVTQELREFGKSHID